MKNAIIIFVVILLVTGIAVAIAKSMQTKPDKGATNPDGTTTSEVTGTTLLETFQNMFGDQEEVVPPLVVESMPVDEKII